MKNTNEFPTVGRSGLHRGLSQGLSGGGIVCMKKNTKSPSSTPASADTTATSTQTFAPPTPGGLYDYNSWTREEARAVVAALAAQAAGKPLMKRSGKLQFTPHPAFRRWVVAAAARMGRTPDAVFSDFLREILDGYMAKRAA